MILGLESNTSCLVWWHISIIPSIAKLRQEHGFKFKVILGYTVSSRITLAIKKAPGVCKLRTTHILEKACLQQLSQQPHHHQLPNTTHFRCPCELHGLHKAWAFTACPLFHLYSEAVIHSLHHPPQ